MVFDGTHACMTNDLTQNSANISSYNLKLCFTKKKKWLTDTEVLGKKEIHIFSFLSGPCW